jgi:hypothetical protein
MQSGFGVRSVITGVVNKEPVGAGASEERGRNPWPGVRVWRNNQTTDFEEYREEPLSGEQVPRTTEEELGATPS